MITLSTKKDAFD